jgi:hypothetical protein
MAGKTETATGRPKPKRRWFQYSLRTLLVFVAVCAIGCSWLCVKMRQAKSEHEAATAIEKLGGFVGRDDRELAWQKWLEGLLGEDFFANVDFICSIGGEDFKDTEMAHIGEFPCLRFFNLICYAPLGQERG